jgi:hypothetical protein
MGRGYADEGEEVLCLAFAAAVEPAAVGEPGHGPLNNPSARWSWPQPPFFYSLEADGVDRVPRP